MRTASVRNLRISRGMLRRTRRSRGAHRPGSAGSRPATPDSRPAGTGSRTRSSAVRSGVLASIPASPRARSRYATSIPWLVQAATAEEVPYSMSSGWGNDTETRWKASIGKGITTSALIRRGCRAGDEANPSGLHRMRTGCRDGAGMPESPDGVLSSMADHTGRCSGSGASPGRRPACRRGRPGPRRGRRWRARWSAARRAAGAGRDALGAEQPTPAAGLHQAVGEDAEHFPAASSRPCRAARSRRELQCRSEAADLLHGSRSVQHQGRRVAGQGEDDRHRRRPLVRRHQVLGPGCSAVRRRSARGAWFTSPSVAAGPFRHRPARARRSGRPRRRPRPPRPSR